MDSKIKIIVGLGNPGSRYKDTRHNIGYMTIEKAAKHLGVTLKRSIRLKANLAEVKVTGSKVVLVRPRTFMNNSGVAVSAVIRKFKSAPEELLVIYDDVDLPLGAIRFRKKGSSGGHRGLGSIQEWIQAQDCNRLRVGIGRPTQDTADYVLSPFTAEEKPVIDEAIQRAVSACFDWIEYDATYVMEKYNQSNKEETD